jgi:tRNA(Ile)-lysidine synthase
MNLIRGSGAQGLGGMSPVRVWKKSGVMIGRPLLSVSKAELRHFLKKKRAGFRNDHSNKSTVFFRNWLRLRIVPALEKRAPGFQKRLANTATVLREEEAVWTALLDHMSTRFMKPYRGGQLLDFEGVLSYSAAAVRRFLRRAMGGDALDFDAVERLKTWMASPPNNGRIWQGRLGWVAERLSKSKGAPSTKLFWIKNVNSK